MELLFIVEATGSLGQQAERFKDELLQVSGARWTANKEPEKLLIILSSISFVLLNWTRISMQ
jgi:hypothetical protein